MKFGDAALFANTIVPQRKNYFFIFYSERLETVWIMSSEEYINNCTVNKNGKNKGKTSIKFNGKRKNEQTGKEEEYALPRFEQYIVKDFSKFN
ncbi:hypothetical protein [Clostridium fermenticellae]|uniref:hypothetical protein n=1 Tax=Clostridium fermenticellae TaxID=2068654 RepID=UPI0018F898BA|nr:hypothetical protein [Clostridium fermenticellae]